jgi:hypothetical protein
MVRNPARLGEDRAIDQDEGIKFSRRFTDLLWISLSKGGQRDAALLPGQPRRGLQTLCYNPVFLHLNIRRFIDFGVAGLRKALITTIALTFTGAALVSCGSSSNSTAHKPSGLTFRVFISNPLQPSGTATTPVFDIADATNDTLSLFFVSISGAVANPGMMVESTDLAKTLVFSPTSSSSNSVAVVDNTTEAIASSGSGSVPAINLPGPTESMVVGVLGGTGYAAIRTAPVTGQPPGAILAMDLTNGQIAATLPLPNVHYIVQNHGGTQLMAFADGSSAVTLVATAAVGTNTNPFTTVTGPSGSPYFDNPVWGIYSADDTTAYILNCGAECGGTKASVTVFNLNTNTPTATIPVHGATYALLSGTTLYVAGTPPGTACPSGTQATACGTVDVVDLTTNTVTASAVITDGNHNRMELSGNGQLFIGSRNCTNINSGSEVRGCLAIFNTLTGAVNVPLKNGDVTGIAPITGRNAVYVCQNGALTIYDTTTDHSQVTQIDIVGAAVDVKLVDR